MNNSLSEHIQSANTALIVDGQLDACQRFFSEDYVAHVTRGDLPAGHDGIRKVIGLLHKAFTDLAVEVEILVETSDRIAWQRTLSGKHTGSYKGFPATDKKLTWRDMVTSQFRDGLIAEEWVVTDLAEQLLLARKR